MRRALIGWLTAQVLLLSPELHAQAEGGASVTCATQILVYVDVSRSVRTGDLNSPYAKLLDAFERLVEEAEVITETDEVVFRTFHGQISASVSARGSEQIKRVIGRLRAERRPSTTTNFVRVLEDLEETLGSRAAGFTRRLVIIASDFVHDPDNHSGGSVDRWRNDMEAAQLSLPRIIESNPNTTLLLLAVDAKPSERDVAEEVLAYLRMLNAQEENVESSAIASQNLADLIHKHLIDELLISARFAGLPAKALEVTVRNPNCQTVMLDGLWAGCGTESGPAPVPAELPFRGVALRQGEERTQEFDLDDLGCPAEEVAYRARATLAKGPDATAEIAFLTKLEAKPTARVSASREPYLFQDTLRLYVDLRGQILERRDWEIKVGRSNAVDLFRGRFQVPADIDPESWSTFLLILPGIWSKDFEGAEELSVQIPGVKLEGHTWALRQADLEARLNWLLAIIGVLTLVIILVLIPLQVKKGWVFGAAAQSMGALAFALVPVFIAWWMQWAFPDHDIRTGWLDAVQASLLGAGLAWAVFLAVRAYFQWRLGDKARSWREKVRSAAEVVAELREARRLHGRNKTALVAGGGVFLLAVGVCLPMLISDPESPQPPEAVAGVVEVHRD